jgi:hypothetical protein
MRRTRELLDALVEVFRSGNRVDPALLLTFLALNGLVLVNACLHDPRIGYDAHEHLRYLQTLSELRLVAPQDSQEFFSPPLPYSIPGLLMFLTGAERFVAARVAQFINVAVSVGVTWYLLRTCQLISPRSSLKLGALLFLAILPVYYKTFAFMRGEPFVVLFSIVAVYYVLLILKERRFALGETAKLGLALGLCALSRQWGVLLFPAIYAFLAIEWLRFPELRIGLARVFIISSILALAICGWFYASLYFKYGSIMAFNRNPALRFSLGNQPPEFYYRLSAEQLFSKPVRPAFPNQFLPIFYSEVWGDYWGYFVVYGKDTRKPKFLTGFSLNEILSKGARPAWLETNYETMSAYLGRVNLVSLFPSTLALASFVTAIWRVARARDESGARWREDALLLLVIAATMAGYLWFLIKYPNPGNGNTIKATYVLHVLPFVAILVGELLDRIQVRSDVCFRLMAGALLACWVHNFLAMVTNYQLQRVS